MALAKALDKTKSTLSVAMAGGAMPANKLSEVALLAGSSRTGFAFVKALASSIISELDEAREKLAI